MAEFDFGNLKAKYAKRHEALAQEAKGEIISSLQADDFEGAQISFMALNRHRQAAGTIGGILDNFVSEAERFRQAIMTTNEKLAEYGEAPLHLDSIIRYLVGDNGVSSDAPVFHPQKPPEVEKKAQSKPTGEKRFIIKFPSGQVLKSNSEVIMAYIDPLKNTNEGSQKPEEDVYDEAEKLLNRSLTEQELKTLRWNARAYVRKVDLELNWREVTEGEKGKQYHLWISPRMLGKTDLESGKTEVAPQPSEEILTEGEKK